MLMTTRFVLSAFLVGVFVLWSTHVVQAANSKVRVAIPSESMAQIAFYVGIEKGYYNHERLWMLSLS